MTESTYKKPKDGRYHAGKKVTEIEPVIAPLSELDEDEDAIDRLLIDTGFDTDEDFVLSKQADIEMLRALHDHAAEFDAFIADDLLAKVHTGQDEPIEPVDLDSALDEAVIAPAPWPHDTESDWDGPVIASAEDRQSAFDEHTDDFSGFADQQWPILPNQEENEYIEAGDLDWPLSETEFTPEPLHSETESFPIDETFTISNIPDPTETVKDRQRITNKPGFASALDSMGDIASSLSENNDLPYERNLQPGDDLPSLGRERLDVSQKTNYRDQHLAVIEKKARKACRLAYSSLAVAALALLIALTAGYLNYLARNELSKLKDMSSIIEEDLKAMSQKQVGNDSRPDAASEIRRSLPSVQQPGPVDKPSGITEPQLQTPKPVQTAMRADSGPVSKRHGSRPAPARLTPVSKAVVNARPPKTGKMKDHIKLASADKGAKWSINLASFRRLEDARKNAAEFRRQGVSARVVTATVKHNTWYRLSIGGFRSKATALAHSAKLKKQLQLNSIWVANI